MIGQSDLTSVVCLNKVNAVSPDNELQGMSNALCCRCGNILWWPSAYAVQQSVTDDKEEIYGLLMGEIEWLV